MTISLSAACRKISVKRTTGTTPGGNQVGQDGAGADRRKLIHVAHQDHAGVGGNGPQELMAQDDIDHRNLVQHEQIAGERVLLVLA